MAALRFKATGRNASGGAAYTAANGEIVVARQLGFQRLMSRVVGDEGAVDDGFDQRLFGFEVIEDGGLANPGFLSHGVQGEIGRAFTGDDALGGVENG
nr:hypothetical protein [Brevundimonas sp.]